LSTQGLAGPVIVLSVWAGQGKDKVAGVLDFRSQPFETKHLNCQPFCALLETVKLYSLVVAPDISEKVVPALVLRYY